MNAKLLLIVGCCISWRALPCHFTTTQPSTDKITGVALVIHGLNLKPANMGEVAQTMRDNGIITVQLSLTGHLPEIPDEPLPNRDIWLQDITCAMDEIGKLAQEKQVPIYLAAYSLGALLSLDWMSQLKPPTRGFDQMILFAPSLSLRWYSNLIRWIFPLGPSFKVPTAAPPEYHARNYTYISAYEGLFDSLKHLNRVRFHNANIPALVFISNGDELVSPIGLQWRIAKYKLPWQLVKVSTKQTLLERPIGHLIIDERSVGPQEWQRMQSLIHNFIEGPTHEKSE